MINLELQKVYHWLESNKLFTNFSKSNFLIFTKQRLKHNFNIMLGPVQIYQKDSTNYLGVTLDDKLTWKPHIEKLISKLSRACYLFYKVKQYVNESTLKMLYFGLVYPHLQYQLGQCCKLLNIQTVCHPKIYN